jgi:hypothetical protein
MTEIIIETQEYERLIQLNDNIKSVESLMENLRHNIINARKERTRILDKTRARNRYYNKNGREKKRLYYLKSKRNKLIGENKDLTENEILELQDLMDILEN